MIDVEALYAQEYGRLCGWFRQKLFHSDQAVCEDLAAEVFARVWAKRESYAERPGATVTSWLYRIASNLLIDHCRAQAIRTHQSFEALDAVGRAPCYTIRFEDVEQHTEVSAAIETLPGQQRAVIVGRFLEGRKIRELTHISTLNGVKKLQDRGLVNLRRCLMQPARVA